MIPRRLSYAPGFRGSRNQRQSFLVTRISPTSTSSMSSASAMRSRAISRTPSNVLAWM